jgi:hypothetical protein
MNKKFFIAWGAIFIVFGPRVQAVAADEVRFDA